jgi:hypothetical protein
VTTDHEHDHVGDGVPRAGRLRSWARRHLRRAGYYPTPTHTDDVEPTDGAGGEAYARWLDLESFEDE